MQSAAGLPQLDYSVDFVKLAESSHKWLQDKYFAQSGAPRARKRQHALGKK